MENEFVTYEQAVALKELGFDGYTFYMFDGTKLKNLYQQFYSHDAPILAPLKQQVFRWFREKYGWYVSILFDDEYNVFDGLIIGDYEFQDDTIFYTYEEAENACIDKLIELAIQQNK